MTTSHQTTTETTSNDELREKVAERYGALARRVLDTEATASCCGPTSCAPQSDPITTDLYSDEESESVPESARLASLGCGNPTALADLGAGQVVLDLGSGGGIDVLLSARRVGPTGKAYGLDMTDDMLELARKNQREAGIENAEFLKGTIEDVPLPDDSVDVIISNCVINLSADKPAVFREAHRVLRPGGRFAVSDIVIRGDLDSEIRHSIEAWIGCVAGALDEEAYRSGLEAAGFVDIDIQPTRIYRTEDAKDVLEAAGINPAAAQAAEGQVISAFIRATKR